MNIYSSLDVENEKDCDEWCKKIDVDRLKCEIMETLDIEPKSVAHQKIINLITD